MLRLTVSVALVLVLAAGAAAASSSRSLRVSATAYCLRGRTATGASAGPGVVAVDPAVIRLGSRLVVAGYGRGRALDTGAAIRGARIDVWLPCAAARRWGRRTVSVLVR